MAFSTNNFMSPMNIASPLSPLNPLNPLNPASPFNPLNQADDEPAKPVDKFALRKEQFTEDLKRVAGTADWGAIKPGAEGLKQTANGFALHIARSSIFGPTRDVEYLFDKSQQTVEVTEQSLKGPVREFFSLRPEHEHYILNLDQGTYKEV